MKDKVERFKADEEALKRLDKALDDYRRAVRKDTERPVVNPSCTCCIVHGPLR